MHPAVHSPRMTQATDQEDDPGADSGPPDQTAGIGSEGFVDPKQVGVDQESTVALLIRVKVTDQPGVLPALTEVISHHRANITLRQPRHSPRRPSGDEWRG